MLPRADSRDPGGCAKGEITGIGGLLDAVGTVFTVYGSAAGALIKITAVCFIIMLVSQGAAWMIVSDRMQAMAAADGAFFSGFFGRFHRGLGTPGRVNLLSGVVGTTFLISSMQISGDSAAVFGVVLTISISTFLLSYLLVIPAAVRLRGMYPNVPRPFKVPVSDAGFKAMGPCASRGSCSGRGWRSFRAPSRRCSGSTTPSRTSGA